ncbi:MAG: BPSS1780 family membrane protein [Gallionella sp.]
MEPQHLKAGQGWEWIKQGYALFMKSPILWVVLLSICVIAAVGISSVPVIGEPLVSLLMPVVLAGLMTGCRSLEQGEELELAHLFSGFKQHTSHLVALGGISLVSQYLIFGAMIVVGGATLVHLLMSGQQDIDPNVMMQALTGAGFAMLLGIVLFSLLMMAMQYAPMLVFFNGVTPLQGMKLSLRAFLHNIGPMLVYGLTFLFLGILASLPMMLGWLVLLPLVFTSLYASYRDIFPATAENQPAAGANDPFTPNKDTF